MKKNTELTPELAGYMAWATEALATENGISQETHTPEQFGAWIAENFQVIAEKAMDRMRYITFHMVADEPSEAAKALKKIMGIRVWERVNVAETRRSCRLAEEAALASSNQEF